MMDARVLSRRNLHVKSMPVHQNANIIHGLAGLNVPQLVVAVKNHVIVSVNVQMDIRQTYARITVNAMVNHVKKRTAILTLNVPQNVNLVLIGNHGFHALRLAEVVPRADRKNVNARTLINAKDAKVSHQLTTFNVILSHVLAGVIGLHGLNVQMHVAKM